MTQLTVMDKYPVNELTISKEKMNYKSVDEVLDYLKEKIDAHPVATFISIFDHYTHTKGLEVGEINEDILDAKNIIFCFGKQIPNAAIMAVRPRSIAVVEYKDNFVITFMDAPNPQAHEAMISWVENI